MGDDVIGTLASLTLSAWSRRQDGKAKFDQYEAGLIHAMKKANLKTLDHHGWTLKRVPIPQVTCRSCHQALEPTPGIDPDHIPERIQVVKPKRNKQEE